MSVCLWYPSPFCGIFMALMAVMPTPSAQTIRLPCQKSDVFCACMQRVNMNIEEKKMRRCYWEALSKAYKTKQPPSNRPNTVRIASSVLLCATPHTHTHKTHCEALSMRFQWIKWDEFSPYAYFNFISILKRFASEKTLWLKKKKQIISIECVCAVCTVAQQPYSIWV